MRPPMDIPSELCCATHVSWGVRCSSVAPVIGSLYERVALPCSCPNRRWTSALEVVVNYRGRWCATKLQHLCGGQHVSHHRALLHDFIRQSKRMLHRDGTGMDGHCARVECNLSCYSDCSLLPFYTLLAPALVGSAAMVPGG